MAYWRKKRKDISDGIPFPRVPNPQQISAYIKKILKLNSAEFFELEPMEVEKTNLDGYTQGAILGKFVNEPTQDIKGGVVLPLFPNMKHIPLKGEHVLVGDYNNQHYYFGIINRTNSVNENAQPGIAEGSSNTTNTKYGKTFERKDIRPVTVNEGEIVYSGRFGQSIKFGCNTSDNSPNIKIRCGQKGGIPESPNQPVKEDIERDGSSIYLLDNGLPYNAQDDSELFDGEQIKNKKILIKSDGIFISGRDNIKLRCINNITVDAPNFNVSGDEVKLGSIQTTELQPVVKGDDLKQFLNTMLTDIDLYFTNAMATIPPSAPGGGASASPVFKAGIAQIKLKLQSNQMLSRTVKTK
tara:strand:+ start:701 stop:1762 length:1062 start_codon:yes stop_codon:yes gene_type:complete